MSFIDRRTSSVSEEAVTLFTPTETETNEPAEGSNFEDTIETAFSLSKFIPLLSERLYVLNPYTRTFLVTWIATLNSIPDLDLATFLPDFLDGLIHFLSDTHQDVRVATSRLLDGFLDEIKRVKLTEKMQIQKAYLGSHLTSSMTDEPSYDPRPSRLLDSTARARTDEPLQFDVMVDFTKILEILQRHLTSESEAIQLTALRWVSDFFAICPGNLLPFTPQLLRVVLPALSHESTALRRAAREVNDRLLTLIRVVIDRNDHEDKEFLMNAELEELDFVNSAVIQL